MVDQFRHELKLLKTRTREKLIKIAGQPLVIELTIKVWAFERPPAEVHEFPTTPRNTAPTATPVNVGAVVSEFPIPTGTEELVIPPQRKQAVRSKKKTQVLTS